MKAPDVIYLAESDKVKGELHSHYISDKPFFTHTSIEYIRKDALLEWANGWLAFKRSGVVLDDGFSYAMEELNKKLNEM